MKLTVEDNINYAARVVTVNDLHVLEGCDKIQHAIINGNRVIVSKDLKPGARGIFFPVESQIDAQYLSLNNNFSNKVLNVDPNIAGFFPNTGRVKCVKLRGFPSEGYLAPFHTFESWLKTTVDFSTFEDNFPFDHIDGKRICRKYLVKVAQSSNSFSKGKKSKRPMSRMIENQYRLHYDTPKLGDNMHRVKPDDLIVITNKLHGTSVSMARIQVKRSLTLFEKVLRFFGVNIQETEYDNIYASRSVIKNDRIDKVHNHFYADDVWGKAFKECEHALTDGISLYGEIVGFTQSGGAIQKGYDYGMGPAESKTYIYRITKTGPDGHLHEFSMFDVIDFCKKYYLNHVPIYYIGKATELFKELSVNDHWHSNFLERLRESFNMEKDCELCVNKVPAEGIVLRVLDSDQPAYKFKSFKFLKKETEDLDKGEVDLETMESEKIENEEIENTAVESE